MPIEDVAESGSNEDLGATILPFPARRRVPVVSSSAAPAAPLATSAGLPSAAGGSDAASIAARARLAAALADLDFALAEQRAAVAAFRTATAELGQSVRDLGAGLEGYRERLGAIRGDLENTRERALELAGLAEKLESQTARH